MRNKATSIRSLPAVLIAAVGCLLLLGAVDAVAEPAAPIVHESFTPDRLGAATNLSVTATFAPGPDGAPPPVTKFTSYLPAGLVVDARGTGTCAPVKLQELGPKGCPANSRAGFGGGIGVLALPKETIRESFTLDFFFAPREKGRLALLVYASAVAPVVVELVVVAKQVPAPKPYGLGFSVEVPLIATIPGASYASIESVFATLGSPNVAYWERVHGKRRLVHLKGVVVPKRCPKGGFPTQGIVQFLDGTTVTVDPAIPCPGS